MADKSERLSLASVEQLLSMFAEDVTMGCDTLKQKYRRSPARKELERRGSTIFTSIVSYVRGGNVHEEREAVVYVALSMLIHRINDTNGIIHNNPLDYDDIEAVIQFCEQWPERFGTPEA